MLKHELAKQMRYPEQWLELAKNITTDAGLKALAEVYEDGMAYSPDYLYWAKQISLIEKEAAVNVSSASE